MYAFLSHDSACEALRFLSPNLSKWPSEPRRLPQLGDCISSQKAFKAYCEQVDLAKHGVTGTPVHLLVPSARVRSRGKEAKLHVWSRLLPEGSLRRVGPQLLTSGPELTIFQYCGSQAKLEELLDEFAASTRAELELCKQFGIEGRSAIDPPLEWERTRRLLGAVVLACEFAGTYRLAVANKPINFDASPLMTCDDLRNMAAWLGTTSVERRVKLVADLALEKSASPMETAVALMLTLPVEMGGFGLPKPQFNVSPDVRSERGTLSDRDEVKADMLWEDERVVVEYDSYEFHGRLGPWQLSRDALRANILTAIGYSVFRVTFGVVASLAGMSLLARQIAHVLGVELEAPNEIQLKRRTRLYVELMPKLSDMRWSVWGGECSTLR